MGRAVNSLIACHTGSERHKPSGAARKYLKQTSCAGLQHQHELDFFAYQGQQENTRGRPAALTSG